MTTAGRLRRAATTVLVAVLVAAGCVLAGLWQWHRHVDRSAAVALVEENYGAAAVPAEALLTTGRPLPPDAVWRTVTAQGHYLGEPVLLRNRPVDSVPGFHVLAPFRIDVGELSGTVLVVDRGWVPTGPDASGVSALPVTPTGRIVVTVRLRADEPASGRDAPPGQVQAISVAQVRAAWADATHEPGAWPSDATLQAYGALGTEDGSEPEDLGALPRPSTDLGPHLSYAFQWWVFALGALVGAGILIARDEGEDAGAQEPAAHGTDVVAGAADGRAAPRPPTARPARRRRRPTAEEEEDALLDAQG